jgi:hypothetical protein
VISLWTGCLSPFVRGNALFPVTKFQMGFDPRYLKGHELEIDRDGSKSEQRTYS